MVHGPTGSGPTTPNYKFTTTPAQAIPECQGAEDLLVWPDVAGCEELKRLKPRMPQEERLSESRMRENLTYGLKWLGMET